MNDRLARDIARRIKTARLARGMTQAALAAAADMSGQQVAGYEAARYLPQLPQIHRLADALSLSMAALLEDKEGVA